MNTVVKLVSSAFMMLAIFAGLLTGETRNAAAATTTITCSVAGFNAAQPNTLQYDHSAGTCTLTVNTISPSSAQFDIVFFNQIGGPEQFRIGDGTTHSATAHKGCSMGSFTAAAGASCSSNRTTNGTETATVLIDGENGATIRMTVSYTLAGGLGNNFTYNSASVTITTPDVAASTSAAAQRAVQGSVTRSQSVVIGQNFGSRVANVASGTAPGGALPGSLPGGSVPTQQFGVASSLISDDIARKKTETKGTTLRGLAMLASFDSSRLLAAAQDSGAETEGAQQRTFLSGESAITIWGHGSLTDIENTRNRSGDDNRYDGSVWGYNLGADYRFSPALVAGLSVGYAQTDITTTFETGTYDEDTWNLSPYVIYTPTDTLTFSAIAGYAFGDVTRSRNTTVTGTTDSQSWYLQIDGRQSFDPWDETPVRVTTGLGALLSRNTLDAYTESDGSRVAQSSVNTVQLKPNVEFSYAMQIGVSSLVPYAKAAYVHDFTDQTNDDAGAFDLGGGLRFTAGDTGLAGTLEGSRLVGRDDFSEYTLSGFVAYGISVSDTDGGFAGLLSPYVGSSLSEDGATRLSTGATLSDFDDRFSSKLNISGDPATRSADILVTVDLKF